MATTLNIKQSDTSSMESYNGPEDVAKARAAVRRVDLFIVLPIVFMFVFLQYDRTSISNALTSTLKTNINITTADVNLGQTLFTLGIFMWEIPSNIVIKRFGAHRWLPLIMFCWGTVTWCQIFLKNRTGFLVTRFILASCEAGFIPGAAFYLGQFLTRRELALRYALLWSANSIAGATGGVLALGLLNLSGKGGLHGWQWLFLIEGSLTCAIAVLAALHIPSGPADATRRHRVLGNRLRILKPEQAELLASRAVNDDPTKKSQTSNRVKLHDFDFLLNFRVYGHLIMAFLSSVMVTPINTYAPSVIKSLGYLGYSANGLNSVGSACCLIVTLSLAYFSDRTGRRGPFILAGFLLSGVGLLWLALPPTGTAKGILYAGIIVTEAGMGSVQGINAAWLSQNVQERQRPVALACYVMCIQLAGFLGANLFVAKDAPRYVPGLLVCAGCVFGAAALSIGWMCVYKWWPKGGKVIESQTSEASEDQVIEKI